jgi:hypothetical protein
LAIHCAKPATASPEPRIWFGNISPSITHITGPQLALKKITYRLAATSAIRPLLPGRLTAPAASVTAVENAQATVASVTAMPADPTSSNGLRPMRSTVKIVNRHAPIDSAPDRMLVCNAWSSVKPTASHRVAP